MFKWPVVSLCTALTFVCLIIFRNDVVLAVTSVMVLGAVMLIANWSLEHLIVYAALFTVGLFMEIVTVYVGLWSYAMQNVFGIPLWVPFVWANSGLFVVELKEVVDKYLEKS